MILNKSGYYPEGLITGYYRRLTKGVVERFQKAQGLSVTGQIDEKTSQALSNLVKKYYPEKCQETPKKLGEPIKELPKTSASSDTNIYRNDHFGIGFRYLQKVGEWSVNIKNLGDEKNFELLVIKNILGQKVGKGGEQSEDVYINKVAFHIYDLKNDNLCFGLDLSGQGGYCWLVFKRAWYRKTDLAGGKEMSDFQPRIDTHPLSWEQIFDSLMKEKISYLPITQTLSGQKAYPYFKSRYEESADGYYIFDKESLKAINFQHDWSYPPEKIKKEIELQNQLIYSFLKSIVETLKFFEVER